MGQLHKRGLVFGSLNLDYVYEVDHIVSPGETLSSVGLNRHQGGKGLNQAIALANAGCDVSIAGKIGSDGIMLKEICERSNVYVDHLMISRLPTGNAIIQVDKEGQNSILLYAGANRDQTKEEIGQVLDDFSSGDYLFLQNEINGLDVIIREAYERGLKIVLNPSPFEPALLYCGLDRVHWFILNEVEICQMTEKQEISEAMDEFVHHFPEAGIVLTLGDEGAYCYYKGEKYRQASYPCRVVDTTAAGDTFTGFFFAHLMQNEQEIPEALDEAARAASITVSRKGAAETIPMLEDIKRTKK